MDDIKDSELVGDWLVTGGQLRIGLYLHQDGGYALEQLATESSHRDHVTASHSGTWTTIPAVMPEIHLPQVWLHLTVRDSHGRQSGNQFAWPNETNTPDIVMLLVQKHAPGVFNVIDTFDDQFFSTIMILSDRHEPQKPASAQAAASTPPPVAVAPVPAPPVPVEPPSQEEVLAGLQAELEKLRASLAQADGPSLRDQVETMRRQLQDKQDALAISRQTDALDAEKKRLSAQKELLDAQADAESARAKVRQAQAAQEAQIRQIQMQIAVDDAKAADNVRQIQASGDAYAYTVNQDIYTRGVEARNKAHDAFMRAMFRN
jgi:hypothetical protein